MLTVAIGSTWPFRWMNSSLTGEASTLTVLPAWFVKVRLWSVVVNDDSWSFAVLDARTTTLVLPLDVVPVPPPPLPPHPAMKVASRVREEVHSNKGKGVRREGQGNVELKEYSKTCN